MYTHAPGATHAQRLLLSFSARIVASGTYVRAQIRRSMRRLSTINSGLAILVATYVCTMNVEYSSRSQAFVFFPLIIILPHLDPLRLQFSQSPSPPHLPANLFYAIWA